MIAAILALFCAAAQDARPPWTTSRVLGTPDDPPPFRTEPSFPKLRFHHPIDLVRVPGSDRLAVAQLYGVVQVFADRPDASTASTMLAVEGHILGMAFHPRYVDNGYFYAVVAITGRPFVELTRYTIVDGKAKPETAAVILRWPFTQLLTHLGGALRFGPDGFLYVGIGDGMVGYGARATGQDPGDLESSILRIDVDRPPPHRRYAIPRDNPFVNVRGARPEIWAFGLRQPWKMSFDSLTGDLWVGDVGETLRESIFRIRRGGNYGWSVMEGGVPLFPGKASELSPISPPVVVHPHTEFRSITGGTVYRGTRLPDLAGSYIYGDYETGRIWEVRLEGEKIVRHRELAAGALRIISFAEDAQRELLVLDYVAGTIHRLVPNAGEARNADFPRTLGATGLFASVRDHRPAEGVVPYSINAALWSDGSDKERFIALPGSSRIRPDRIPNTYVQVPGSETWDFPDGTVLVKTFSIGGRRIETRLLHLKKKADTGTIQDQEWRGYSYRWNEEQTDADLVDAAGRTVELRERKQTWRYPSRNECIMCHSMAAHFVLGVLSPQLNREVDIAGLGRVNQIEWFRKIGLFEGQPKAASGPPRLLDYEQKGGDPELKARSYLQANCAHCHVNLGGGNAAFQAHALLPLERTGLVDVPPLHGSFGVSDARLVAPGSPERSLIVQRMGMTGPGRMPPLASHVVDEDGVKILSDWIRRMPPVRRAPPKSWTTWAAPVGAAGALAGVAAFLLSARRSRRARSSTPPSGPPPTR